MRLLYLKRFHRLDTLLWPIEHMSTVHESIARGPPLVLTTPGAAYTFLENQLSESRRGMMSALANLICVVRIVQQIRL